MTSLTRARPGLRPGATDGLARCDEMFASLESALDQPGDTHRLWPLSRLTLQLKGSRVLGIGRHALISLGAVPRDLRNPPYKGYSEVVPRLTPPTTLRYLAPITLTEGYTAVMIHPCRGRDGGRRITT